MLELVELLILAVLCSSTQGMYIDIKIKPSNVVYCLVLWSGRLVQVSGNEETCSKDIVVFWCSNDMGVLNWEILDSTGRRLRSFSLPSNKIWLTVLHL